MFERKDVAPTKIIYDITKDNGREVVIIIPDGTYIVQTISNGVSGRINDINVKRVKTLDHVFYEVGGEEEFLKNCDYEVYCKIFDNILIFENGVLGPAMFKTAKNSINTLIKLNNPELGEVIDLWSMTIVPEYQIVEFVVRFKSADAHISNELSLTFNQLRTTEFSNELFNILELAGPDVSEICFGATDEKFEPSFEFNDAKFIWIDSNKIPIHEFYNKSYTELHWDLL